MLTRILTPLLQQRLRAYPAVALVGPRQCGKTTLAQSLRGRYFDLEQEVERLRLDLEWDDRVGERDLLILDEAQSWPALFPRLRAAIDAGRKRNGRFLLLGSVSPFLMRQVSESLAGRLAILELTPFLWSELVSPPSRERLWLHGGYPDGGVLTPRRYPSWELDYLRLLVERDLPLWGMPARPQVTSRFLRMLAAIHGQVWNASQVGASLGLSYPTVNSYLDYLVGAFLIRRLEPFQANLKKRLVKSPKVYWRDPGLLHALLNVADREALLSQPWVGASWEGFVIEQAIGALSSNGRVFEAYYFRTSDQFEIDLVLETPRVRWAIEIKLTTSPGPSDLARLNKAADMIGAERRVLVSRARTRSGTGNVVACDLAGLIDELRGGGA